MSKSGEMANDQDGESEQMEDGGIKIQTNEEAAIKPSADSKADFEEECRGESVGYLSIIQDEVVLPDSFEDVESAEGTTLGREIYKRETTFTLEGDEEGEDYPQTTNLEYHEEGDGESDSTMSQIYEKLSPFLIKWSYGIKASTKLINLTKDNQFEVFYSASHFGVLYNYRRNTMRFLPGHNSAISSIAADSTGRWLVTADDGADNVIIVWDHQRLLPCWSLFNIFSGKGTRCVQISQDAKFLAAISSGTNQLCKFYLWTYGRDQADGEVELGSVYGSAKSIHFNHMETTQFAITMETRVMYCQWIQEKKFLENFLAGIKKRKGKIGIFRETIFLDDNHTAITSTSSGHVVIWSDSLNVDPNERTNGNINKKCIKTIKIHKTGVTSLLLVDQIIVTCSDEGIISFHDQTLSLLYFARRYHVEPIICVSCNLQEQSPGQIDPLTENFDDYVTPGSSSQDIRDLSEDGDYDGSARSISDDENITVEIVDDKKSEELAVPSDYTIDMKPFPMRDLIFLAWNGRIGYVSHRRSKVRYLLFGFGATVISMDCNPNVSHLAMGYSNGTVDLFDYRSKVRLVSKVIAEAGIVTLKYSPAGRHLMAGVTNGAALLLDPIVLTIRAKFHMGRAEIQKCCFTSNEKMFAYYDKESTVYLYKVTGEKNQLKKYKFIGGYKSHYKPIRDILFDEEHYNEDKGKDPKLYTIGEDRMLVEYDVSNSQPGVLKLKRIDRIEQTAIPKCFALLPRFGKRSDFLIVNSEYKFKAVCRNTRICYKTTLGPTADTPPHFIKIIPCCQSMSAKMIYSTEKNIGLRHLPSTGNPYEGMGMVGHPIKITSIAISHDYKYIFTAGLNDTCILAWKINLPSVEIAHQLGGTGLEPFLTLIEGGANGFLYREMEDFFYYAQIIHQGEHANMDRHVSKSLALCEIPDLVRALGYFPTEYEIENIIREIKHMKYEETGELLEEITFDEFVKMFLNHRPINGISMETINKALVSIADLSDPECILVEKEELYRSLEERGEAMSHAEVVGYLCILLLPKDEKDPLPVSMTIKDFAEDILGIDLTISEADVREITNPPENKAT